LSDKKRAVIFANGVIGRLEDARAALLPGDVLIAADGGARQYRRLGIQPHVLIGDFDSLDPAELQAFQAAGVEIIRHPARKDYTDLELAIRYAQSIPADEILVLGALGARWDQTVANLLLPAASDFAGAQIRLLDGPQEVLFARRGDNLQITGQPGDTVSLIPLGSDAHGITTTGLEYPLAHETLYFGTTRGISNVLLAKTAGVRLEAGLLICVVIHAASPEAVAQTE
jgi:thiamine pyrophosphokinase